MGALAWGVGHQQGVATKINIVGRQRMLSQDLSQTALQMQIATNEEMFAERQDYFVMQLKEWVKVHDSLLVFQELDESGVAINYEDNERLQNSYQQMVGASKQLAQADFGDDITDLVEQMLQEETTYLYEMNEMVIVLAEAAEEQVEWHAIVLLSLLGLNIILLIVIGGGFFGPMMVEFDTKWATYTHQLARLQAEVQRQQLVSEAVPVGLFLVDERGNYLFVNRKYVLMSELWDEEILEKHWAERLHVDYREAVLGKLKRMFQGGGVYESEHLFEYRSGEKAWLRVLMMPIFEKKELVGYAGTCENISKRKWLEKDG
ncbi:MAG TPA: PAS domain S-box protein [Anaerolineae bacterium]|nr:PAS domain S-box protein [Anaerolineae bacterium]